MAHFIGTGVNFGECDILTTHSRESDVLTTHSLTSHFIGETSEYTSLYTLGLPLSHDVL